MVIKRLTWMAFFVFFSILIPTYIFAPTLLSTFFEQSFVSRYEAFIQTLENKAQEQAKYEFFLRVNQPYLELIPAQYRSIIAKRCYEEVIPIPIVYAVIVAESSFENDAINDWSADGSIDRGLMQINSDSQSTLVKKYYTGTYPFDPFNPENNIEVGIKYLKHLYLYYGSWKLAFYAYNTGATNVNSGYVSRTTKKYAERIIGILKENGVNL